LGEVVLRGACALVDRARRCAISGREVLSRAAVALPQRVLTVLFGDVGEVADRALGIEEGLTVLAGGVFCRLTREEVED
jgi:hypothetical protein